MTVGSIVPFVALLLLIIILVIFIILLCVSSQRLSVSLPVCASVVFLTFAVQLTCCCCFISWSAAVMENKGAILAVVCLFLFNKTDCQYLLQINWLFTVIWSECVPEIVFILINPPCTDMHELLFHFLLYFSQFHCLH